MKKLLLGALVAAGVSFHAPAASACHLEDPKIWWCYTDHLCEATESDACQLVDPTQTAIAR